MQKHYSTEHFGSTRVNIILEQYDLNTQIDQGTLREEKQFERDKSTLTMP